MKEIQNRVDSLRRTTVEVKKAISALNAKADVVIELLKKSHE